MSKYSYYLKLMWAKMTGELDEYRTLARISKQKRTPEQRIRLRKLARKLS